MSDFPLVVFLSSLSSEGQDIADPGSPDRLDLPATAADDTNIPHKGLATNTPKYTYMTVIVFNKLSMLVESQSLKWKINKRRYMVSCIDSK